MNLLQTIEKLAVEANAEGTRRDKQIEILRGANNKLIADHSELCLDYDQLHKDCEASEQSAALCKMSNKGLLKELAEKDAAIIAIKEVNQLLSSRDELLQNEIDRLKNIERENQVLKNDNRKLKDQVIRHQKVKPVKAPKVTRSYKQIQQTNEKLNKYIGELVKYGNSAPQFLVGLKHSKQGVMDFIDCKPEPMGVQEKGGDEIKKMVQRVIIINQNNSTKVMTRIIGEEGLHTCKIPTGGTVQIDDEVRDHVNKYFKTLDEMNEKLKGKKAA